jgi:hypothetical protein
MESGHDVGQGERMVSSHLMRFSLLALILSFACFAMSDATRSRPSEFPTLPLPPPGLDARMTVYASVGGLHELWVDVAAGHEDALALNDAGRIDCIIGIYEVTRSGPVMLARSTLRTAASYRWGHLVSYSSEDFQLPPGEAIIQVRNEGCAAGSAFQGGMMYLHHPAPVTFPLGFLWNVLAYGLGLCSICVLAVGFIAVHWRSQRESIPPG